MRLHKGPHGPCNLCAAALTLLETKKNMDKHTELRRKWEQKKARRLQLRQRPDSDLNGDDLVSDADRISNIKKRFEHLSEVLALLYKIYRENKSLYGDRFLAFVGNEVVREWPWKDFPFISKAAYDEIRATDSNTKVTGLLAADISDHKIKTVLKNLRYEHWTPISFFRDVFDLDESLTQKDFYYLLINYYRVVWITKDEDKLINRRNKTTRSISCYEDLGIVIEDEKYWEYFTDE